MIKIEEKALLDAIRMSIGSFGVWSPELEEDLLKEINSKALRKTDVIGSYIPEATKPPLYRIMREGVGHFCANCGSTMPKSGFLMLFGKRYCDNDKCPNSKPLKNYR